jgi:hypothetical protein
MRATCGTARWIGFGAATLVWSAFAGVSGVDAQVGDISQVSYPGWVPSDRVAPNYTAIATYNAAQDLWTYQYTVANAATAQQALQSVTLRFNGPLESVVEPRGWYSLTFPPPASLPGVFFGARLPERSTRA